MKKLFTKIWSWFKQNKNSTSIDYGYKIVDDLPNILDGKIIYIVGLDEYSWLLSFKCPCGCGDEIQLNLLESASPCWSFSFYKNRISISPSIHRISNCKSHFFIKEGLVIWRSNEYNKSIQI